MIFDAYSSAYQWWIIDTLLKHRLLQYLNQCNVNYENKILTFYCISIKRYISNFLHYEKHLLLVILGSRLKLFHFNFDNSKFITQVYLETHKDKEFTTLFFGVVCANCILDEILHSRQIFLVFLMRQLMRHGH